MNLLSLGLAATFLTFSTGALARKKTDFRCRVGKFDRKTNRVLRRKGFKKSEVPFFRISKRGGVRHRKADCTTYASLSINLPRPIPYGSFPFSHTLKVVGKAKCSEADNLVDLVPLAYARAYKNIPNCQDLLDIREKKYLESFSKVGYTVPVGEW